MNTTTASTLGTTKPTFWKTAREQLEAVRSVKVVNLALVATTNAAVNDTTIETSKSSKVIEIRNMRGNAWHVDVLPKKSIRLHGTETNTRKPYAFDLTFKIGDIAVYGGYNLTYTGTIVGIGEKTVRIEDCGRVKALRFDDFAFWNRDFDAERIAQENADTMMRI
jgi:hypothetical protein